jgi:GGDEF domain-containing protein
MRCVVMTWWCGWVAMSLRCFYPMLMPMARYRWPQRLCEQIAYPLQHDHQLSMVTASIGIVMVQAHLTAVEMLRHADIAMYEAKRWGKKSGQAVRCEYGSGV